jgi:hypothetical protein
MRAAKNLGRFTPIIFWTGLRIRRLGVRIPSGALCVETDEQAPDQRKRGWGLTRWAGLGGCGASLIAHVVCPGLDVVVVGRFLGQGGGSPPSRRDCPPSGSRGVRGGIPNAIGHHPRTVARTGMP